MPTGSSCDRRCSRRRPAACAARAGCRRLGRRRGRSVGQPPRRGPDGAIVHGWNVDGLLDRQVVSFQLQRRDASAIATLVGYAVTRSRSAWTFPATPPTSRVPCAAHPRLDWWRLPVLPGRRGNVLPRLSFVESEDEARRMGDVLAAEVIRTFAGRERLAQASRAAHRRLTDPDDPVPLRGRFRERDRARRGGATDRSAVAAAARDRRAADASREYDAAVDEASARGAGAAELRGLLYHAKWARTTLADLRAGLAPAPSKHRSMQCGSETGSSSPRRAKPSPRSAWRSRSAPPAGRRCSPATRTERWATSRRLTPTPRGLRAGLLQPQLRPAGTRLAGVRAVARGGRRPPCRDALPRAPALRRRGLARERRTPVARARAAHAPANEDYSPPITARHPG